MWLSRRNIAITLCVVQITLTVVMPMQVESLAAIGPALSLTGLMLAVAAKPLNSWTPTFFGLSAPLVVILGAILSALFDMRPSYAIPILFFSTYYVVLSILIAVKTMRLLWVWCPDEVPLQVFAWQYRLRSMLWTTTSICVLLVLAKLAVPYYRPSSESFGLLMFALATTVVTAGVSLLFIRTNGS